MESEKAKKLKAFEFLCDNRFGVLSTTSLQDNTPQGSLIYYVIDEKFIYFIATKQSRKFKNISKYTNVSFTVFTEIPPIELQLEGITEVINDPDKKSHISKIYLENANKNPDTINWPPILKLPNDEGFEFVKITVSWFKFSDFQTREGIIVEGTPEDWH